MDLHLHRVHFLVQYEISRGTQSAENMNQQIKICCISRDPEISAIDQISRFPGKGEGKGRGRGLQKVDDAVDLAIANVI